MHFLFQKINTLFRSNVQCHLHLCYGTHVAGFETMVIMDLWGMTFDAVVVIALFLLLLLESI